MNKAVFLDRDGTIIEDKNYICNCSEVVFLPNVIKTLRLFQEKNYLLIVISNQSGVGRGYFSECDVEKINKYINLELSKFGVHILQFYYCPHYWRGQREMHNKMCSCRKPSPGLIMQAAHEHNIDLYNSYMFGDKESDVMAGLNAGINKSYLIDDIHSWQYYANRIF